MKLSLKNFLVLLGLNLFLLTQNALALEIENFDEIQRALNVQSWNARPLKKRVKVAVLDKAFYGYQNEIGKTLPEDTQYFKGPIEAPPELKNNHGLVMAQVLTHIMGRPELYLYNTYGYSNLKFAIEDLVVKKVDLVLYAEVWEFGGNQDGNGFINTLVNKALDSGVTWVNAAGNFEQRSYSSAIQTLEEDWVSLPDQNNGLRIECNPSNKNSKCPVRIVLSWNDFKDDPSVGTDRDLDLAFVDDFMSIISTSSLKQTLDPNENRPGFSLYPRETITAEVSPGTYFVRVKNRSHNFKSNKDELLITVNGDGVHIPSHSSGKSILNPADNPGVITVGALDSERSSFNPSLLKPDFLTMSSIKTSNDGEFRGSSNAAAFVAGSLGLAKSRFPNLSFESILNKSTLPGWANNFRGLSLHWLGFSSDNGRCFNINTNLSRFPQQIIDAVNVGGLIVQTTAGLRVMTPYDPIGLNTKLNRYQQNDLILTTPEGYQISPRNNYQIPYGWVEVFQTPQEISLCQTPQQPQGDIFRLYSL